MHKYSNKSPLSLTKVLELIGKPVFFLFAFCSIIGLITIETIKKLVQLIFEIRPPSFQFPRLKLPMISHLHIKINYSIFAYLISFGIVGYSFYYFIIRDLPSVRSLTDSPPSLSTKIYDRHDVLLYQIYKDENRSLISLKDLPQHVVDATLAAEDKNFYHHHGVDLVGIIRAATNNLTKGTTQGGSTITQQLVKNTLLSPEKTFTRKLKELILAVQVELTYSKDQILEMYLNQVGYGGTAYGIEEATHQYFGKSARDLTISESAMLAGLPISPTILSPWGTSPYLGKIRQQQVLESMVEIGSITENDKLEALSTPLVFHPQGITIKAPHFVMYVKDLLVKQYGESTVARGGLIVKTTLDLNLQDILQNEINTELDTLSKLHVQNGAGLIINPKTGEILSLVGSRNFFDSSIDGQVNIALQQRQPGSSIKPITYTLALLGGATPNTIIDDSPVCFVIAGQPNYCPKNYDGKFHGKVTLRTALGSSYNIPAIKLLNSYGLKNMIDLAKKMGITTWDDPSRFGLSLTLGGGEVTMLDLASVYAIFANNGQKVPFSAILSVTDSRGNDLTIKDSNALATQIIDPAIAYQINSILSDPIARAPAFGINSVLGLPGKNIAVKTGTTNNLRDNWTFGYAPEILVSTWVGNNDNTPMSSVASGITGASPIWARTMKQILGGTQIPPFTPPNNIVKVNTSCTDSPKYEYFIKGNTPAIDCSSQNGTLLPEGVSTSR
ncbi:MAG: transglycosylase domain-containing protein [bacterium]